MDVNERILQLLQAQGWSQYRLAKKSGLSESTLANLFKRNTVPTVPTLEQICGGFGITLSQFFSDNEMVELTPELKELFESWRCLTAEQKAAVRQMIKAMRQDS